MPEQTYRALGESVLSLSFPVVSRLLNFINFQNEKLIPLPMLSQNEKIFWRWFKTKLLYIKTYFPSLHHVYSEMLVPHNGPTHARILFKSFQMDNTQRNNISASLALTSMLLPPHLFVLKGHVSRVQTEKMKWPINNVNV